MRCIIAILFFFGCIPLFAQKRNPRFVLKEGCYVRGYNLGTPNNTTYWYVKKDSTFIHFFETKEYNIKSIRMGKWQYLGDSMISIRYFPLKSAVLLNYKVEYQGETKGSTDSVYFYGSILGYDKKPLSYSAIVIDNPEREYARFGVAVGYGFRGITVDANGNFNFAVPKNLYFGSLGVSPTPDHYPLTVNTFPNNNYHTLNITLPLKDSTNDIDISKFDYRPDTLRYRPSNPNQKLRIKSNDLPINFLTSDKNLLLNMLYESRKKQPYLVGPIDELIEYLKH
ncbi:MAG: hypothetical protein JNM14_13080 [Ferruginibacter sp.]|nr:hypothetical protein [Ferruginibacter sp.]